MGPEKIFLALSSSARRQILAHLAEGEMTAGAIAERFEMTKPSISKHLGILENAGLITGRKSGSFIHYSLVPTPLGTAIDFLTGLCPTGSAIRREAKATRAAEEGSEA